jgi:hypothetical protein
MRLWPFSWTIAHSFGVAEWLTRLMTPSTCLSGMTKNTSFLHFRAIFMSYSPQFWVLGWFTRPMTLCTCLSDMTKNLRFSVIGRFCELLPTILGFRDGLQGPWHLVHVWVTWPKTRSFCVLVPFSWTISHNFGVPGWFTRTITLSTYLRSTTKNLSFLCV